ncbi:hypothetical protein AMECASPLE_031422 [Ameca splendens]|uniref:C2H2-type domain-containing protein n=1 Tax=Ameca splendens TaxID=208324 RepID=A0ABV0Z4G7_9TELE
MACTCIALYEVLRDLKALHTTFSHPPIHIHILTMELGKTWEEVQNEDDRELVDGEDDEWSDWQAHPVSAVCLFCDHQSETLHLIYTHMKDSHGFDLPNLKMELNLGFYQQVKLVNFIRRQIHQSRCYGCQEKFDSRADMLDHIISEGHLMKLPQMSAWDQPQWVPLFPSVFMLILFPNI